MQAMRPVRRTDTISLLVAGITRIENPSLHHIFIMRTSETHAVLGCILVS